ncbi:MAG: hypothetical protein RLZZ314_1032 [Bacteroidota bacterium]|jgi:membrane protein implicated in regulation of membrane protease activity
MLRKVFREFQPPLNPSTPGGRPIVCNDEDALHLSKSTSRILPELTSTLYLVVMHWDAWQLWMAAALALVILEIFVPGFVLACLGVGALAAAGAASLSWSLTIQFAVAALFSLLSFVFLRPLALKFAFSGNEAVSGVEALVGKECRVTQAFDAETGMGRCKIDGDDWRAMLVDRAQASAASEHSAVWVVRVESNTLVVSNQPPVV